MKEIINEANLNSISHTTLTLRSSTDPPCDRNQHRLIVMHPMYLSYADFSACFQIELWSVTLSGNIHSLGYNEIAR